MAKLLATAMAAAGKTVAYTGACVCVAALVLTALALRSPSEPPPLVHRPYIPRVHRACCSRPREDGRAAEASTRQAFVVDAGCAASVDAAAHEQLALVEHLAASGARPVVLALALACDDLGGPAAVETAAQRDARDRIGSMRGADVRWLRAQRAERSTAPLSLQLSRLVYSHAAEASPPYDRIVFADRGGLAQLSGAGQLAHTEVVVRALGPSLWRRQWCLEAVESVDALDEADRERLAIEGADEVHVQTAELWRWMRDRRWRVAEMVADAPPAAAGAEEVAARDEAAGGAEGTRPRVRFVPAPPTLARPSDPSASEPAPADPAPAGTGDVAQRPASPGPASVAAAPHSVAGGAELRIVAPVDWGSAAELGLVGATLQHAAKLLRAAAAPLPRLDLVPRDTGALCASAAGAEAAASARAQLLSWLSGSHSGWAGRWYVAVAEGGAEHSACALESTPASRIVALFALGGGAARAPELLPACAAAGARVVAADVPEARAALAPESWPFVLHGAHGQALGAALVAALHSSGPPSALRPAQTWSARHGWWAEWVSSARAAAHGTPAAPHLSVRRALDAPIGAGAAAGAEPETELSGGGSAGREAGTTRIAPADPAAGAPPLLALCVLQCSATAPQLERTACAAVRAIRGGAQAAAQDGSASGQAPAPLAGTALIGVGARAEWSAALEACGVPRAPADGAPTVVTSAVVDADSAGARARARAARAPWFLLDELESGRGACGAEAAWRAASLSHARWLVVTDGSTALASPRALAVLARHAHAAAARTAALTPVVTECVTSAGGASGGGAGGAAGLPPGEGGEGGAECTLCIPSGAAVSAGALADVLSCGAIVVRRAALLRVPAAHARAARAPMGWVWHALSALALNGTEVAIAPEVGFERSCARWRDGGAPTAGGAASRARCAPPGPIPTPAAGPLGELPPAYAHVREPWTARAAQLAQLRHGASQLEALASRSCSLFR